MLGKHARLAALGTAFEAVHELGHTFGLLHCFEPSCVMHASTYVEEIDLKSPEFCTECLRAMAGRARAGQSA